MSWIRSAVNKAVEVGGNSNLTRAVRSYADTVVSQAGQAAVGGAKLFQDRIGARNFQNYKLAVKRLEEVSVSCRGLERVQLLRRWLVALKEIERLNEAVNTEHLDKSSELNDSPAKPNVVCVLYYDPDLGGELNFRDVFLHSQALEGITLSLILEEPNEEELSLLLEIFRKIFPHPPLPLLFVFRLCLMGGKEAHDVAASKVRDLGKAFSTYNEEVLAKREELLQYAQDAIAGLKVNAEIVRIDSEVSNIHKKLDDMKNQLPLNEGGKKSSEKASGMSTENLKEALAHIKICSRLEELLLRKKLIKNGGSAAAHNQKVDKLKILSESLASSASKAEKRISENRLQKEEALKFRVTKTSEVSLLEKVTTALTSARARLHNAREERDQFDEASNEIIQHFKLKDDELSKSIASYRAEAEVCNTFVNFLESTWNFQSSYTKQKEKLVNDELESHEECFVNWAISILAALKEELGPSISSIRELVENLKRLDGIPTTEDAVNSRKTLEEQYQTTATKLITTFSVVESIKKTIFYSTRRGFKVNYVSHLYLCIDDYWCDGKVKELLDALEKIKCEFESIERPTLEFEATPRISFLSPRQPTKEKLELNTESTSENEAQRGMSLAFTPIITLPLVRNRTTKISEPSQVEHLECRGQLSKLKLELELESHSRGNSMEGIIEWEFDEKIEKEPRPSVQ
ncbi:hypothetical protein Pfo_028836 [Paulownia fortunei]|nr:hypothetical protein Pfo_028836 [Paulownia fortunei]